MSRYYVLYTFIISCVFLFLGCTEARKIDSIQAPPHCLSSQSQCTVINELGRFDILFNVDEVRPEQAFNITLVYETAQTNITFTGYIEGKDMFMGKIPVFFTSKVAKNQATADVLLASCGEERMTWRLWVNIDNSALANSSSQQFFIDFMSVRN